jgi:hypothetical protein
MNAKELTISSSFSYLQRATEGKARSLVPESQISKRFWDANPPPPPQPSNPSYHDKVFTSQVFSYMFLSFYDQKKRNLFPG